MWHFVIQSGVISIQEIVTNIAIYAQEYKAVSSGRERQNGKMSESIMKGKNFFLKKLKNYN